MDDFPTKGKSIHPGLSARSFVANCPNSVQFTTVFAATVVTGFMGDLIVLADRFADRSRPIASAPVAFFFDLACPFSYLAAERVERLLGDVEWIPSAPVAAPSSRMPDSAERDARALRVPLV